jgi:hypothetical protein
MSQVRLSVIYLKTSPARALHSDRKIVIMLAADRINVFPVNNAPGTVVTLMDTSNVDIVLVAGKIVKWQGKLVGVDFGRLRRMIENSRDAVLTRAGYAPDLFGSCCAA